MGTHNRVLSLGRRQYLEVIAIDPQAPPPARPRWFDLDQPQMRARLASGPALIHWVERTTDIEAALRTYPEKVEVLDLSRADYRWKIGVPADGGIPCGGRCPTLIQWQGDAHPADRLPPSGCELVALRTQGRLEAEIATPAGRRRLPSAQE
jgi:glyoxalase-like protein